MTLLLMFCAFGLLSGFLLMIRVPRCSDMKAVSAPVAPNLLSIIIPARNEEENLPRLLESIASVPEIAEIIVVDDDSTDRTAEIARLNHAHVIHPGKLPENMTGKAWACACGAEIARAPHLLFLDADTFFKPGGLQSLLHAYLWQPENTALSVLPFAVTKRPYEELSLFFNFLMAFGAGGFGVFQPPRLFGQSLLISRELYARSGGHTSVGRFVLENFHMSNNIAVAQGRSFCMGGKGALHMRMFPNSLGQLCDGWTKAFADGARSTDVRVLIVSILWLSALASIVVLLFIEPVQPRWVSEVLYLVAAGQVVFFARKIGSFRAATCLLFPLPLVFFFFLFTRSALRRIVGRPTNWRGRSV